MAKTSETNDFNNLYEYFFSLLSTLDVGKYIMILFLFFLSFVTSHKPQLDIQGNQPKPYPSL